MICPDFFCCMIIFYLRLDHLVYDVAPQTNPIKLSCYMDEDAVGKLKKLAMASSPQNMVDTHLTYASVGWGEWNDSWTFTSKKWEHQWNSWTWWPSTNYLSQPTTWHLVSSDVKTPVTSTWPRWRERLGLGWWESMGTTKIYGNHQICDILPLLYL